MYYSEDHNSELEKSLSVKVMSGLTNPITFKMIGPFQKVVGQVFIPDIFSNKCSILYYQTSHVHILQVNLLASNNCNAVKRVYDITTATSPEDGDVEVKLVQALGKGHCRCCCGSV